MLNLLKKLFRLPEPKAAIAPTPAPAAPSVPMPTVEVAHLSLAAIVARFPDELKSLVLREPETAASVALPVPTILKQLPNGVVKMSLATLQRQAQGLIKPLVSGDKRTVDVPLVEVFRHIRPQSLKRRSDQRQINVPEDGFNLFGDSTNPFAVAPDDHIKTVTASQVVQLAAEPSVERPRVLKMDDGLREHFAGASPASSQPLARAKESPSTAARVISPPPDLLASTNGEVPPAATAAPAALIAPMLPVPKPEGPTLALKVAPLATQWPEAIRAELAALDPETTVVLPANDVSAGLAKGRVTFTWAQIYAWLEPEPSKPTTVTGNTALLLPLKVLAPVFLAAAEKPSGERKSVDMDETIPALFSDSRTPVAEEAPTPIAEAPIEEAPQPGEPVRPEPTTEPTPEPIAAGPKKTPESVGEIAGEPHKKDWTPSELIAVTAKLPGVAGAIVALQEGLPVASSLPEGVKSEVVAAFLPQIFARLNQYAGEMKLGDVDDLLFTTHGAHCQIYRLGFVYFAILGKPGESLPWHEMRLITDELARQTHQ